MEAVHDQLVALLPEHLVERTRYIEQRDVVNLDIDVEEGVKFVISGGLLTPHGLLDPNSASNHLVHDAADESTDAD